MNIKLDQNGSSVNIALEGRLDTNTAPELENKLSEIDGVKELCFDFSELVYISSAGLRVLLAAQKKMNTADGSMKVLNPNELITEVFEATGFDEILDIEKA